MEEKKTVFRKNALERLSAPEQLSDYLRVTRPMVWVMIAAIALLLAGIIVWAFAGTLSFTVKGEAMISYGEARIAVYNNNNTNSYLGIGMKVYTEEGNEMYISETEYDDFGRCTGFARTELPDGIYDVNVVVREESPIRMLLGEN